MHEVKNISITKNSLYSIVGLIIPTLVVFAAFPVLIHRLGYERFGIYTLASTISGTMAFLDLGLAAAATRFIAEDYAKGNFSAITEVLGTSFYFYGMIAIVVGGIFFILAPWITHLFSLNRDLYQESVFAFRIAGLQFGASLIFNLFVGVSKALLRFDVSSKLVIILTIGTLGAAVLMVLCGVGLRGVVVSTLIVTLILVIFAARTVRNLLGGKFQFRLVYFSLSAFRKMLGYGIYMSFNSLAGLFLLPIQKLLVGYFLGPAMVTFYTVAFSLASRIHGVTLAAAQVMFPFSRSTTQIDRIRSVYRKMLTGSFLFGLVTCLPLFFLSFHILKIWLGADIAQHSARLLGIFAIAFFFLSLTPAPYFLIAGLWHPRINSIFLLLSSMLNILFIAIQYPFGLTLESFGYAFLIANSILAAAYLLFIERKIDKITKIKILHTSYIPESNF